MPTKLIAFALYDGTGAALSSATPSFTVYKGSDGISRSAPSVSNMGGGLYQAIIPAADVADGVVFLLSNGVGSVPRYIAGSEGGRVQGFGIYDGTGAPLAGGSPAFAEYLRSDGTVTSDPVISDFGGGLYAFIPSVSDFTIGVAFLITTGHYPPNVGGYAQQVDGYSSPALVSVPVPFVPDVPSTTEAYARQLKQLFPPGKIWNFEPDSVLSKTLLALATEFARVDTRCDVLVDESDPRTATETLDWWESALGLPDEVVTEIPGTTAGRRVAITQKYTTRGGQSRAFFVSLGALCGYTVTITDGYSSTILRSGFRCGSRCYGEAWAYYWLVTVQPPSGTALTHTQLEAAFNRAKPAHTIVGFTYL